MKLRLYREADEEAVVGLWNTVFPDPTEWNAPRFIAAKKLATQRDLFFVAVAVGTVVGTAMGGLDGHQGRLYAVAVRPDSRRRRIGSGLVRRVEAALVSLGCPKLNLQLHPSNAHVVAFYERLGYSIEGGGSMGKRLPAAP